MKKRYIVIILIIVIWNIILTYFLFNNSNSKQTTITEENVYGISTDLTKVAQDSYTSVVSVRTSYGKQSGFVYKQENDKAFIVTTYHGIGKDNTVSVTFANNKTYTGTVIGFDYLCDVAVISIESPFLLNVVKCGDNEFIKNGEFIININSSDSKDMTNDVSLGIVSNKLINIDDTISYDKQNYYIKKEVINLSLQSNEGNSGSPIFNMKNEVVGMIQMNDNKRTFAFTINEIKLIADNIISNSEYKKINLGVKGRYVSSLEEFEKNMLNIPFEVINGYYIEDVLINSLAGTLGIQNGDIIISINGNAVSNQKELLNCLYSSDPSEITMSVFRLDKTIDLKGSMND